MTTQRPTVAVTPIENANGDLTHCVITINGISYDAPFTEGHVSLRNRIEEASGVELTTPEIMAVTNASRAQVERESVRLMQYLQAAPSGTVAETEKNLFWWLDRKGELVWAEQVTIGGSIDGVYSGPVTEFGEIDTEELYAVAEGIRNWLKDPKPITADTEWLFSIGE